MRNTVKLRFVFLLGIFIASFLVLNAQEPKKKELSDFQKFIKAYADFTHWEFSVYYNDLTYERSYSYYSWVDGKFRNQYPSFTFNLSTSSYILSYYDSPAYGLNKRLAGIYCYVNYIPKHTINGYSYYYIGPYDETRLTVNSYLYVRFKKGNPFFCRIGENYSYTKYSQFPTGYNFSGSINWWYNPATQTWEYLPGVYPSYGYPYYTTTLGNQTTKNLSIYVGFGYRGKRY